MPFIDSRVNVKTTPEQQKELKARLGQAIAIIPGKSESVLMIDLADDRKMYFRGDDSEPAAFVYVYCYGTVDQEPYAKMCSEVKKIYGDVLGIKPENIYVKYDATVNWG